MDSYDVVAEATQLIEENLAQLQLETEARRFRIRTKSNLACRCLQCQAETFTTYEWLRKIRKPNARPETAEEAT